MSKSILGVTVDDKLTFEDHLRTVSASNAQNSVLRRKSRRTLGNDDAILETFLPLSCQVLSIICQFLFAANCQLKLLDRMLTNIRLILLPDLSFSFKQQGIFFS